MLKVVVKSNGGMSVSGARYKAVRFMEMNVSDVHNVNSALEAVKKLNFASEIVFYIFSDSGDAILVKVTDGCVRIGIRDIELVNGRLPTDHIDTKSYKLSIVSGGESSYEEPRMGVAYTGRNIDGDFTYYGEVGIYAGCGMFSDVFGDLIDGYSNQYSVFIAENRS